MSALEEVLSDLAAALEVTDPALVGEPVQALGFVPEGLVAPGYIVQAGDPFLSTPDNEVTFGGEYVVRAEVWCVVALGDNETATTWVHDLLEHLLDNLPEEWGLDGITQPGPVSTSEWIAHGCKVNLSRYLKL